MNKNITILTLAMFTTSLVTLVMVIRNLINFSTNPEAPLYAYVPHEELTAMTYDLLYFYTSIQLIFLGITLVMLMFLIITIKNLPATLKPKEPEPKKIKKSKHTKKTKKKKPIESTDGTREEWHRLYEEANK